MMQLVKLIGYIFWALQGYFFYQTISGFIEPRKNKVLRLVGMICAFLAAGIVIYANDVTNITLELPLLFLMLYIGFKPKALVGVSVILLFFPIIIAYNFLFNDIATKMFFAFTSGTDTLNEICSNLSMGITVVFWYVFMKACGDKFIKVSETLDAKSWLLLDTVCLASMAAVMSSVYFTPKETYKVWLCMLACIVTNIGSIRLVLYLSHSIRSDMERKNLKLQKDYYGELEKNQMEIRRFRHDMNNHFSVVAGLLEEGEHDEAREYFKKLSGQMQARGRVFCKDSIVNAVLNSKYNRAIEKGIDCFFNIEINQLLFIDNMDICTIFSNTLDNAIEACEKVEEERRNIAVKARCTENGYFSYEITNTAPEIVEEDKGRYKSTKKDKKNHGIGLLNVKDVVDKYKGTMEIIRDGKEYDVVILIADGYGLS